MSSTVSTPDRCYICDGGPHEPFELHAYWPKNEAARFFAAEDAGKSAAYPSMTAVETLDPREAVFS